MSPEFVFDRYDPLKQDAQAALAAGDPRGAFRIFRGILDYPGMLDVAERWSEALELFAQIAEPIAGAEFARLLRDVARTPENVQALYELGYQLIDHGLEAIAATVLARARELAPGDEKVLTEFVCALERAGRHADACRVLRAEPGLLDDSFLCQYLLTFNALMTGDRKEPRRMLGRLQESEEVDHVLMTRQIEGMLERADALAGVAPLDGRDLRGWHLVLNGTLLLHLSPYGRDEGMNGRYAYTQDSNENCLEAIRRLARLLDHLGMKPPCVYALEERSSAILAHAAAREMSAPVVPWTLGGPSRPGLIVAYDLAKLERNVLASLHAHSPGQILWSHATCWTSEQPFAPDVTTYLYQFNASPWEARLTVDPETRQAVERPAAEGTVEDLAEELTRAHLHEDWDRDLPEVGALARAMQSISGDHAAGLFRGAGARRRHRQASPVPSNRFV